MTFQRVQRLFWLLPLVTLTQQLCLASSSSPSSSDASDIVDFKEAFQNSIAPAATWPCQSGSGSQRIASISATTGMEIECESEIVIAAYSGTVVQMTSDSVILKHGFHNNNAVSFKSSTTRIWYTLYENLETTSPALTIGTTVQSGDRLGHLAPTQNLNFQVMVGAYCSLEHVRQHPLDGCNRKGYDPMVHPLILYPNHRSQERQVSMDTLAPVNAALQQHGVVQITMARPTLTHFQVELVQDEKTTTLPLEGEHVGSMERTAHDEWRLPLVIPYTWLASSATTSVRLSVYDAYGELVGQELVG